MAEEKVRPTKLAYDVDWSIPADETYKKLAVKGRGIGQILEDNFRFAKDPGGKIYYYDRGVYKENAEDMVRLQTKRLMTELGTLKFWQPNIAEHAIAFIRASALPLKTVPHFYGVNLKNGFYLFPTKDGGKTRKGQLAEHDPDYVTTVQLPVTYNPEATCPAWEKFVQQVFPLCPDTNLVWRLVAWLMVPHVHSQKAIMLLGEGSNGKSTLLEAITAFLGSENVSNLNLQRITDRFSSVNLLGKLANIVPDLSEERIKDTSIFKQLSAGEEVTSEIKHGAIFKHRPFARHVFSSYKMPESDDTSYGFYRRFDTIRFVAKFEVNPALGRSIQKQLASPSELSGVLNRALPFVWDVEKNGLMIPKELTISKEEHARDNNPIVEWLDDNVEYARGECISKGELFKLYEKDNRKGFSQKKFGMLLQQHFEGKIESKQAKIDGRVVWSYVNIRLKSQYEGVVGDFEDFASGLIE